MAEVEQTPAVTSEEKVQEDVTAQNGAPKETDTKPEVTESKPQEVTPELKEKIVRQIEYYFGNYNLPRDRFLSAEVKKDEGWIPLTTMLKFARLAKLTKETSVVADAIKTAEQTIMEVDEDMTKIRRSVNHPLPALEEDMREECVKRTIYCKGFPKDNSVTLDELLEFFKPYGEYDSVRMRTYVDKSAEAEVQGFKGSVLVIFKTEELAKAFIEGPSVQYRKVYLIRKWFGEYRDEKRKEIEERKAKKLAKIESVNGKLNAYEDLPKGIFLKATGFADDTSREDIKAAIINITNDCAFIEFRKGDKEALIRFSEAGCNKAMLDALKDKLLVKEAKIEVTLVEGEEEEEQLKKANEGRKKALTNSNASGGGRKRKFGGGGGYRGRNKRQRN